MFLQVYLCKQESSSLSLRNRRLVRDYVHRAVPIARVRLPKTAIF